MSHLRNTFIGVGFAYVQIAVNLVQGLIITPMCLAHIPEATFGAWLVTGNLLAWIGILDPGVHLVLQQRIAAAYAHQDLQAIGRLRLQAYVLASLFAIVALTAAVLALPLHALLVERIGCEQPVQVAAAYLIAAVAMAVFVVSYGAAVVTLGTQAPAAHGVIALVAQAANLAIVIVLLRGGSGIMSLPIGLLVQAVIVLTGNLAYASLMMPATGWPTRGSLHGVGGLVRESCGVFLGRAGSALAANSDMIIASWFLGAAPTVALNITQRAPLMLRTLAERVSHAAAPVLSAIDAEKGRISPAAAMTAIVRAAIWLAVPATVATILWNPVFVRLWAGGEFYAGDHPNALIAIGLLAGTLETTFMNVCGAIGLYSVSGRVLLAKSILAIGMGSLGAWLFGTVGLLAAPVVAGALTTWWLLPKVIGGHSGWDGDRWSGLATDALKACAAAAAAAAVATRVDAHDPLALAITCGVFMVVYAACLLGCSGELRSLAIRMIPASGGRWSGLR
ncbi:MAG: hypothetical protein HQ464_15970 [Planctomycetes bacterium]|nr:hypothetical protein [Planctomycetota bacterium]